jgi:hypothetical protein
MELVSPTVSMLDSKVGKVDSIPSYLPPGNDARNHERRRLGELQVALVLVEEMKMRG